MPPTKYTLHVSKQSCIKPCDISWKDTLTTGCRRPAFLLLCLPSFPDKFQETFSSNYGLVKAHKFKSFCYLKELDVVFSLRISPYVLSWTHVWEVFCHHLKYITIVNCVCVLARSVFVWKCVGQCIWRSEDNFVELVLSWHLYRGSRDRTSVVMTPLPDNTFASPIYVFLKSGP